MIPQLKDILDVLEGLAPSHTAEEWDNSGLQLGHFSQEIKRIFVSLDPTIQALRKASERNAQMLLTHHPLIFRPISSLNPESYPQNVIFEAIEKGISIVAAHTNLDVAHGGINDLLAELFGLQDVEVLEERADIEGIGLGRIGNLPKSQSLSQMTKKVKMILKAEKIKVVSDKDIEIRRVAVVGGSGGRMVPVASQKGADLFITGDVGHHDALEAENLALALIDGGHFNTEKAALTLFAKRLEGLFKRRGLDVAVDINNDEEGPARYV